MRNRLCTPYSKRVICVGSNTSYETCHLQSCSGTFTNTKVLLNILSG